MCLSTVYIESGNGQKEIMKDVARVEAEGKGYWIFDLLGEKRFIEGVIERMDMMDSYVIVNPNRASS